MENESKKLIYESLHSQIYRVVDLKQGHIRILKQLKGEYPSPEIVARFQREFKMTRKLGFDLALEGVIQVESIHKIQNTWAIMMEDFGGKSLAFHLEEKLQNNQVLNLLEFLPLAIEMCQILDQIHQQEIIHKDINPSNFIWNSESGKLKIIDFGISVELSEESTPMLIPENLEGTLAYISPEQTGRMNRALDFRTDLYSLGVSFYQLLTGELPFIAKDSLELVHAHLAVPPPLAHGVPDMVSLIVNKLMSKNAEQRYQSAHGLQVDLQRCLDHLQKSSALGTISSLPPFELGEEDQLEQFHLSQNLFGREKEIELLQESLERVYEGGKEVIWVTGDSGVGKSSLIGEVRQWVIQRRGYFVVGKFDQINQGIPYSSVIQAFQGLVQQLLAEPPEKLLLWKEKLTKNLEGNGQLILDVIPETELILGKQPQLAQVGPSHARHRFQSTFQGFIRAFASPQQILVLFLDDLQWADQASLDLLLSMLLDSSVRGICFLGTYRKQEVEGAHPFRQLLDQLDREGVEQQTLFLLPLEEEAVTELLRETFQCSLKGAQGLGEIALQKTNGNPFFLQQFLAYLVKKGVIYFNRQKKKWAWKIEQIEQMKISENVALLLTEKIQHLSLATQQVMQAASCVGNEFDLDSLKWVGVEDLGTDNSEISQILRPLEDLLQEGFLIPLDENYKYGGVGNPRYCFVHDQVQQAAYTLISEEDRPKKHKVIGGYLLEKLSKDQDGQSLEKHLFDVIEHWNLGRSLLRTEEEIEKLVSLNYQGGKKAKLAAAFEKAFSYFKIAMDFLTPKAWERDFEQTLDLFLEAAEVASLIGYKKEMEEWIGIILSHARGPHDCLRAEAVQVQSYHDSLRVKEATNLALHSLQRVGISFPKKPNLFHLAWGYLKILRMTKQRSLEELIQLPEVKEQDQMDILNLMSVLGTSTYINNPEFFPLIVFKIIELSLKNYGNSPIAIYPYAVLSMIYYMKGSFQEGKRILEFSSKLLEHFQSHEAETKVLLIQYYMLGPLHHSLSSCIKKMEEGARVALQVGELAFVDYHYIGAVEFLYYQKGNLSKLREKLDQHLMSPNIRNSQHYQYLIYGQVYSNWEGETDDVPQLFGQYLQTSHFDHFKREKGVRVLFFFFFHKMQLAYEFGKNELALESLLETRKYLKAAQGTFITMGYYYCFESLILLRVKKAEFSMKIQIKKGRRKLKKWAELAPPNFLPLWLLVEAEVYRIEGRGWLAQENYQTVLEHSRKHHFLRLEALANELFARFYLETYQNRFPWLAQIYLKQSHHCYQIWGAKAKVKQLESYYPQLRGKLEQEKNTTHRGPLTRTMKQGVFTRTTQKGSLTNTEEKNLTELDLLTVTKASQAISGEIRLEQLCQTLLRIMVENLGAEKGALLIDVKEQKKEKGRPEESWEIKTCANLKEEGICYCSEGLPPKGRISLSVLRYVLKTQELLVLEDACHDSRFQNDPYLIQINVKSLLCLPLVKNQELIAIAYFENNLASCVFSPSRVEILKLLSSQAAISIENAYLLENLSQLVEQKTRELNQANTELQQQYQRLKETQEELIHSKKMSGLGTLAGGVAHEINNPLNGVQNHASNLQDDLQIFSDDLFALVEEDGEEAIQYLNEKFDSFSHKLAYIQEGNYRIQNIVQSLLKISGIKNLDYEVISPIQILITVLEEKQVHMKGIELIKQFGVMPEFTCSPRRITEVFHEIIRNSIQAMEEKPKKGIKEIEQTLTVSSFLYQNSKTSNQELGISFQDTGCGMTEDVREKAFEPFFTTRPVGEGLGLGLYVVYLVLEGMHQGAIQIESQQGVGTKITLYLPIQYKEKKNEKPE